MRYRFSPAWLFMLYSVAGYTKTEIAELGGWSLKSIEKTIKDLKIIEPDDDPKGREVRRYIDQIREAHGNAAALDAVRNLLEEMARPPVRVYR